MSDDVLISRELLERTREYIGGMPSFRNGVDRFMEAERIIAPIERILQQEDSTMSKNFGEIADDIIAREVAGQDAMWGRSNERADASSGQLFQAGLAQGWALYNRRIGDPVAFENPPACYPEGWSGFRDYGSDVANLAVVAAFIRQEIKRLVSIGADTTRKSRDVKAQPYTGDQPAIQI